MEERPDWLTPTDEEILDFMEDAGIVLSPAVIAYNLDLSRDHVNRKMTIFCEKGLIEKVSRGYYIDSEE
jgi:hypothetical protein